mgnify:FL=1
MMRINPFSYLQMKIESMSNSFSPSVLGLCNHFDFLSFSHICFAEAYSPPQNLKHFLESAREDKDAMIVYVGFGSIVMNDANEKTEVLYKVLRELPYLRLVISKV